MFVTSKKMKRCFPISVIA